MRSIRGLFLILFGLMIIFTLILSATIVVTAQKLQEEHDIQRYRTSFYLLSQELKQSSDHLTKFARAYAVTGNDRYADLFYYVLNIRNGYLPLPKNYHTDFWDKAAQPFFIVPNRQDDIVRFPTLLERIKLSGINEQEYLDLSRALELSDALVNLEEEAFQAIKGFRLDPFGNYVDTGTADLQHAQALLFSNTYFNEKAKIMAAISNANQSIIKRLELSLQGVQSDATKLTHYEMVVVSLLIFSTILSLLLLMRFYINPLSRLLNTVVKQVESDNFDIEIQQRAHGEIRQFITALNRVFARITSQMQRNNMVKDFNIILRNSQTPEELSADVTSFLRHKLNAVMVGFYDWQDPKLTRIAGIGYGDKSRDVYSHPSTTQVSVLHTKENHSMRGLNGAYTVKLNGGTIELQELHYFPLIINDKPLGLLEIGCVEALNSLRYEWIISILNDLSVSLQLLNNFENQRAVEKRVLEQSLLNKEILDATPNPMYCLDPEGKYLTINARFADLVGMFEVDIIGQSPETLFNEEIGAHFNESKAILLAEPGSNRFTFDLPIGEETRNMTVYEATFLSAEGRVAGIVGLLHDLTEQTQMEIALREAKETADDMSRAKGEFLANMSHEIRTPMNAILGMAHLALNADLNDTQHRYVSRINDSAKSLLGIINDILDFSKIEAGKLAIEHIDYILDDVMDNVATIVAFKAQEKSLEFLFDIDPAIPPALIGDPLRLGQVLVNLCGNAIKFTEHGEIVVSVKLNRRQDDNVVLDFSVRDTGIGISDEKQASLFNAFSQADGSITRRFGGTGLGLSISKHLVELMGGEIRVESKEGRGSNFTFSVVCGLQEMKIREIFQPVASLSNKRVLVVDDNDSARYIMLSLLNAMHFDTEAVASGAEALATLETENFDMIFVDWNMPGLNGVETIKKITEQPHKSMPKIFMVTAYGREVGLNAEIENLVDGLIIKPVNPSNLLDAIMDAYGLVDLAKHTKPANQYELPQFDGQTLLLVEDNETNQEVAKGVLEAVGLNIDIADNGLIALEKLEKQTYEMVLMDMQMPVMDGITATKKIRLNAKHQDLVILAMTANAMQVDVERCLDAGMNDHIAKPLDIHQLYAKLSAYIAPSSTIPATAPQKAQPSLSSMTNKLPDLPGIDVHAGIKRLGGNEAKYWKILENFLQSQSEFFQTIDDDIAAGDWETAQRLAHTLKGSSANLGAMKLNALAAQLEDLLQHQAPPPPHLIHEVQHSLHFALESYQDWKSSTNSDDSASNITKLPMNKATLASLYTEFEAAIESYDVNAQTLLETISTYGVWTIDDIQKMAEALEQFDFEAAQTLYAEIQQSQTVK
ncbi:response regulator [Thaumasiovibrio subtropicus]|uniref:response regulator n=1 Tax=Thaumasiovibrio subtropicus TaxID=1891207 RepID=UPI000B35B1FD|nr:response regulator [Thaumasiovibrio subtropicus]